MEQGICEIESAHEKVSGEALLARLVEVFLRLFLVCAVAPKAIILTINLEVHYNKSFFISNYDMKCKFPSESGCEDC